MSKNNGHQEPELLEETQEDIDNAATKVAEITLDDGQAVSLTKQEASLLQKMLATATEEYKEETLWRMCSFIDEEEAQKVINAFYESKELGMSTSPDVSYAFALCSTNRPKSFVSNLIAQLTGTLQNAKFHPPMKGKNEYASTNPRSPLADK